MFCSHQVFRPPDLTSLLKLERLVWSDDTIPMPAGIDCSLRRGIGGIFNLHVGYANTQETSVILSHDISLSIGKGLINEEDGKWQELRRFALTIFREHGIGR